MNRFILSMAWRETRGAWRHFLYFFVCVAVGVGALVGVSLFAAHVDHAVTREARSLLGGDLEIRSSYPLSSDGQEVLRSLDRRDIAVTHVSELVAMAARTEREKIAGQATQIVELKAVEPAYPFYGTLSLEPVLPLDRLLHPDTSMCEMAPCHGAVVQEALLLRMGLAIGSRLKLDRRNFSSRVWFEKSRIEWPTPSASVPASSSPRKDCKPPDSSSPGAVCGNDSC